VHITGRCNLRCRHCFLGEPAAAELGLKDLLNLAEQFANLQGLRLIISGGEPLLHRQFREINSRIRDFPFRTILLSNGTLIDGETAGALNFHEVQVSIDGLEGSHDLIRGEDSHRKALAGLRHLAEAGVDISVATMVHRANLGEFDRLGELLADYPLKSWSVDVPCLTGNLGDNPVLAAPDDAAAARMSHSFGGGYYGSSGAYACGAHLAAVMADGSVCKCGHFAGRPDGHISEGLGAVWKRLRRFRLEELSCRCSHLESCRGGCRYRAELSSCLYGPDPIQCFQRGVPTGGDLTDAHRLHAGKGKGGEQS
jgi:radical SAM protein with 4Fe4S-binding SPASM domain